MLRRKLTLGYISTRTPHRALRCPGSAERHWPLDLTSPCMSGGSSPHALQISLLRSWRRPTRCTVARMGIRSSQLPRILDRDYYCPYIRLPASRFHDSGRTHRHYIGGRLQPPTPQLDGEVTRCPNTTPPPEGCCTPCPPHPCNKNSNVLAIGR